MLNHNIYSSGISQYERGSCSYLFKIIKDKQSEFYHPAAEDRRQRPSVGTTSGDEVFEPVTPSKMPPEQQYAGPAPARIIRGLKNEQVREDDLIVLKALISGSPQPNVYNFNKKIFLSLN